jgi:hypothetical protein
MPINIDMLPQLRRNLVIKNGVITGEERVSGDLWIRFTSDAKLFTIMEAFMRGAAAEIWRIQDGYGEPGLTPPQGIDWSGIRDSSHAAIEAMYRVAVGHMKKIGYYRGSIPPSGTRARYTEAAS